MTKFVLLVLGAAAVLGGAIFAVAAVRRRLAENEIDFDDFDTAVDDEEFEHFFGAESEELREAADESASGGYGEAKADEDGEVDESGNSEE